MESISLSTRITLLNLLWIYSGNEFFILLVWQILLIFPQTRVYSILYCLKTHFSMCFASVSENNCQDRALFEISFNNYKIIISSWKVSVNHINPVSYAIICFPCGQIIDLPNVMVHDTRGYGVYRSFIY